MNNIKNGPGLFIIPCYVEKLDEYNKNCINDALQGIYKQSDKNWRIILINDGSPDLKLNSFLKEVEKEYQEKIKIVTLEQNYGAGICRNLGIIWAKKNNYPFILFNDADDISDPNRLAVTREEFIKNEKVGLVYSSFQVIDENKKLKGDDELSPPILEILDNYKNSTKQLEGYDAWIRLGTELGYTNKTSATSVLTSYAYKCPFPNERASEDFHTWMRLSALGAYFKFSPLLVTQYRIPSFMKYQASRIRVGLKTFNEIKVRVDTEGFFESIAISLARNTLKLEEVGKLKAKFLCRLALSMEKEGEFLIATSLKAKAELLLLENKLYNEVI